MLRTALLSLALLLGGYGAAAWLTHDFQVWTDEGARRLEVALRPLPLPAVVVDGPGIAPTALPDLLAASGQVTIADFFYTRCKTVCLSLGGSFGEMQAALQADPARQSTPGVQLLSISFDGAYDNPAILARYAQTMGAEAPRWRFARVADAQQQQQLLRGLGVVVIPDGMGDYEHNAALLIFDTQGRMVRIFDLAEQELALNYARHLAQQPAAPPAPTPAATAQPGAA